MNGLKRFPIGLQDFAQIRRNGYYYVDKTAIIYEMVSTGRVYFLSRPRRFGKSLLVSTLKCYFEGRKDLFEGLAMERLEKEWKKHPVFYVSFSISKYNDLNSLQVTLNNILSDWEKLYGISNRSGNEWGNRFSDVIKAAYDKTGAEPTVLVDEYDAPLLDTMDAPEMQKRLKLEMRKFFSPLKNLGGILRFVFLTGITKYSQDAISSGLNNLDMLTMKDNYAAICGITKEASAAGRSDMVVETEGAVYVFEFKLDGTVEEALAQIDSKGYLIPYETSAGADGRPKKLFKIGASFDSATRTLGGWKVVEG